MSDQRQHAEKPLAIGERRAHARTPVAPQAFVKFGDSNYGFVFNISETGLVFAPTGTLTLAVGAVAKMRFLLPDSREWILVSGEVAWIADSQNEAGVRFVDLAHDTRDKIRNWISQEPSRAEPVHPRDSVSRSEESRGNGASVRASTSSPGASTGTFVDHTALNSILADPAKLLLETKSARKLATQPAKTTADAPRQAASRAHVPERRSKVRRRVLSLEYIDLGSSNGGILLNLSEGGMYVQAVANMSDDDLPQIAFRLPDSGYLVKTGAQIAWVGESKKDAGIQFVNLPEEARLKIREWVSVEHPPVEGANDLAPEATPVRKKTERLIEMPPPAQAKKPAVSPESPVVIPQKPQSVFVPPVVAASPDRAAPRSAESLNLSSSIVKVPETTPAKKPAISHESSVVIPQKPQSVLVPSGVAATPDRAAPKSAESLNLSSPGVKAPETVPAPRPSVASVDLVVPKPPEPLHLSGSALQTGESAVAPPATVAPPVTVVPPVAVVPVDRVAPKPAELLHLSGPILQARESAPPAADEIAADDFSSSAVVPQRSWWTLAAVVFIVVLISFVAGWMVAGPGGRKQFLAMFESKQNNTSETAQNSAATPASPTANIPAAQPANDATPPKQSASSAPNVTSTTPAKPQPIKPEKNVQPPPSASKNSNVVAARPSAPQTQKQAPPVAHVNAPTSTLADANRTTRPAQPPASSAASNSSSAPAQTKTQAIQPVEQPRPVPAPAASNSAVKTAPPSATSNASVPLPVVGTILSPVPKTTPPPVSVESSPPPPAAKPAAPAEVVKGTVTVSASPFPSIRVPPEMKSQVSKQGASLEMGQLISRVEPVYPEDAERQRIEGVVKLHIIIGRDGNISDVDKMTGPPLLVAAAANAVRQWRYKPTSLGGQPVEAGVDVTVVFRLQTTRAN